MFIYNLQKKIYKEWQIILGTQFVLVTLHMQFTISIENRIGDSLISVVKSHSTPSWMVAFCTRAS